MQLSVSGGCRGAAARSLGDVLIPKRPAPSTSGHAGINQTADALDGLHAVWNVTENLIGQSWYLLVASFGLLAVVIGAAARAPKDVAIRPGVRGHLVLLLVVLAGLLLVSATFLVNGTRPDVLIYGRYISPVMPPVIAAGVSLLARSSPVRLPWLLGTLVVLTSTVVVLRTDGRFGTGFANRWSIASLPFLTSRLQPAVLLGAGTIAVFGTWLLVRVSRRQSEWTWAFVVALFLPISLFTEFRLVRTDQANIYPPGWTSPQAIVEANGDVVAFDTSTYDPVQIKTFQFFLPNTRFVSFNGAKFPRPTTLVFSTADLAAHRDDAAATRLWRDQASGRSLWRESGG